MGSSLAWLHEVVSEERQLLSEILNCQMPPMGVEILRRLLEICHW
jgi:hypothetical protein